MNKTISQYSLIIYSSIFFVLFYNKTFFNKVFEVYNHTSDIFFIFSIAIVLFSLICLLLVLVSSKYTTKTILILSFCISSLCSYFMNTYHIVVDDKMIQNIFETNLSESIELFNYKQILYFLFLGLLPSYFIYKQNIIYKPLKYEILSKLKYIVLFFLLIVVAILSFSKYYTSFFRENKTLRYHTNPTFWIYNIGKYIGSHFNKKLPFLKIAEDANITNHQKRKLILLVVGEAARFDHFSLNNYKKKTNPLLEKENIISLKNFYSCGTSTAVSVPCMFSKYTRDNYTSEKAISTENILDILYKTQKVDILWKDNNSDSKGVALRVAYENIRNSCLEGECRDEKMLEGLDDFINSSKKQDILIVLHQMGNHGPAYYKRYPKEFEKFKPVCKTNQLEECTKEEITNAYDNAILYTDYFLSKSINLLKNYTEDYDTGLIYMSDHGESLGENGIYLHGMPYFIAPKNQKHIASVLWFNKSSLIDSNKLKKLADKKLSQDNLFDSLLGLFEVNTKIYNPNMDIFLNSKKF